MKFTEFLINEDDLTRGMAKTRQAIGAQGPLNRAGAAMQKVAGGERLMGQQQANAVQPYIQALQKILADPRLASKFKQLAAMAEKQTVVAPDPGAGAEQVSAATR